MQKANSERKSQRKNPCRSGEKWMERQTGVIIVYGPFSVHESNEYNINSITQYTDLEDRGKLLE